MEFRKIKFFSKDKINAGRQEEIDLLRGFSTLDIIICHVGIYLGNVNNTILYTFSDIFGSELGAPIFMALMGISTVYSRNQSPKYILKRGIHLFVLGFILNIFRSLIPLLIFGNIDEWTSIAAFLVVDILQFAGLSFLFLALLKKMNLSNIIILIISLIMVFINQYIMLPTTISWDSELLTAMVNLFCPVTNWSCFPFLTWFAFVAFGLSFGELLIHCNDKQKLYSILLPLGFLGILYVYFQFYLRYPDYTSYYWRNNFYYMGLKNVLLTFMFVFFSLGFWYFVRKIIPEKIKKLLYFLSKNLNVFYIISWLIISLLIHLQALYNWSLNTLSTIGMMILLIVVCTGLTKLLVTLKHMITTAVK